MFNNPDGSQLSFVLFLFLSLEWQDMYQVNLSFPTVQDLPLLFLLSSLPLTYRHRIETGICMEVYMGIYHNPYTYWGATSAL